MPTPRQDSPLLHSRPIIIIAPEIPLHDLTKGMQLRFDEIPLRSIRLQGEGFDRYIFNTQPCVDELADSIGRVSLTSPPIVLSAEGGYVIVCGYARLQAVQRMGWWTVPCQILDEGEKDERGLLLLSIEDNRFARKYNKMETEAIRDAFINRLGYSAERVTVEVTPYL